MDGGMEGWMEEWMEEWTEEWTEKWMGGWTDHISLGLRCVSASVTPVHLVMWSAVFWILPLGAASCGPKVMDKLASIPSKSEASTF